MNQFLNGQWKENYSTSVIRPYRADGYMDYELGPQVQYFSSQMVERKDYYVINQRDQKLQCTLYEVLNVFYQDIKHCIIYLHGNSGNRTEGSTCLKAVASKGLSLCTFDFSGSGKSEGDYVTLGIQESEDLRSVLQSLKIYGFTSFTLWGRSMGATTALYYQSKMHDPTIKAIISDSAYSDLSQVCLHQANEKVSFAPDFIVDIFISSLRKHITSKIKQDPFTIDVDSLTNHRTPCLFVYSNQDTLIKSSHTESIMKNYQGHFEKIVLKGNHNEVREEKFKAQVVQFIFKHLNQSKLINPNPLNNSLNNQHQSQIKHFSQNSNQTLSDLSINQWEPVTYHQQGRNQSQISQTFIPLQYYPHIYTIPSPVQSYRVQSQPQSSIYQSQMFYVRPFAQ